MAGEAQSQAQLPSPPPTPPVPCPKRQQSSLGKAYWLPCMHLSCRPQLLTPSLFNSAEKLTSMLAPPGRASSKGEKPLSCSLPSTPTLSRQARGRLRSEQLHTKHAGGVAALWHLACRENTAALLLCHHPGYAVQDGLIGRHCSKAGHGSHKPEQRIAKWLQAGPRHMLFVFGTLDVSNSGQRGGAPCGAVEGPGAALHWRDLRPAQSSRGSILPHHRAHRAGTHACTPRVSQLPVGRCKATRCPALGETCVKCRAAEAVFYRTAGPAPCSHAPPGDNNNRVLNNQRGCREPDCAAAEGWDVDCLGAA